MAAVAGLALAPTAHGAPRLASASALIPVTVNEGTSLAFALSPDKKTIVFDLQGTLFVMPATGGAARAISDPLYDARQPTWSPDGKRIAFQSNYDGLFRIWTINADGSNPQPLTSDDFEGREPSWAPTGERIAFTSERSGKFDIWEKDLKTGALTRRTTAQGGNSRASYSADGQQIAYVSDRRGGTGVYVVDAQGKERQAGAAQVFSFGMNVPLGTPSISPNGKDVAWVVIAGGKSRLMLNDKILSEDEDVQPFRVQWLSDTAFLYSADGKIKKRDLATGQVSTVEFTATLNVRKPAYTRKAYDFNSTAPGPVKGVQRAVISPDGKSIAFTALGELWVMPVGGKAQKLTSGGTSVTVDPAWSPDGKAIVYANDRAGTLDLWIRDLATGQDKRVTQAPGAEMRPSWSHDGKSIVYVDASGAYSEAVHVLDLATGANRPVESAETSPGYPEFTADDKALLVSRLVNASTTQSYYVGGENQIRVAPLDGSAPRDITVVAGRSIGNRSGDGPALSPDGKAIAFQMDSALWVAPLSEKGAGAPRKVADDIVNALSWAADSRTLLGVAGGRMTLYDTATGKATPVKLDLTWTQAKPTGTVTIHAGKVVTGTSDKPLIDQDIVVEGNRIVAIRPHGSATPVGQVIDASTLTVMPGLMDMHEHLIKTYGASFGRLLLSWGVTTVRSPGNVPGDILEEREAIDAGQRPGPRMFVTGYLIDGKRTVWEMGTTVATTAEADRQVAQADALGYDMIKTYVHTSEPMRRYITQAAHKRGLSVSSHEIYPAATYGSDSVEHLDGNGAARGNGAKATQLNFVYDDVAQVLAKSGMAITPTTSLFTPYDELIGDKAFTSTDPRWGLQPVWVRSGPSMSFADPVAIANIRTSILKLHKAGVKIVAGTDSPFTPIGINTHNEIEQAAKAGLTPLEAIRTATAVPAELLGVAKDLGTVEVGKLADLVFVEGDPLTNVRDARNVRKVMKNGQLHEVSDLVDFPAKR